eukprot:2518046-Prymnesium_polylepis.1
MEKNRSTAASSIIRWGPCNLASATSGASATRRAFKITSRRAFQTRAAPPPRWGMSSKIELGRRWG